MAEVPESTPLKLKPAKRQVREVVIPDDKHFHQRFQDGSEESFSASCRACVKSDRERKPVSRDDLANTVFLFPRHYGTFAKAYLAKRYPGLDLEMCDSLPIWQVASAQDYQIVLVRPVPEVGKQLEPFDVRVQDNVLGKFETVANDPEKILTQFCESEPLKIEELCTLQSGAAGRITVTGNYDARELIKRIHEGFGHCARVQVPAPDRLLELMTVGPA